MDELTKARHDLAMLQARCTYLEQELAVAQRSDESKAELRSEMVFGAFDGMTSVAGTILALF